MARRGRTGGRKSGSTRAAGAAPAASVRAAAEAETHGDMAGSFGIG